MLNGMDGMEWGCRSTLGWYGMGWECRSTLWNEMELGAGTHFGMEWYGVPEHTLVWYGMVWNGVPEHTMVWYGKGCRSTQWFGMVWDAGAHNGLV